MDRALHDIHVTSAILNADLTDVQKLTYIAIRSRQGYNPWCFAGQRVLAGDIGKDQSQVSKAIRALVRVGWVERSGRKLKCLLGPGGPRNTTDLDMRIMTLSHINYDSESSKEGAGIMTQSHRNDDSQTYNYDAESSPSESQHIKPTVKPTIKQGSRFVKPDIEAVREHAEARGSPHLAEAFHNYQESKGWVVGKAPMKDWKAAFRTFELNDKRWNSSPAGKDQEEVRGGRRTRTPRSKTGIGQLSNREYLETVGFEGDELERLTSGAPEGAGQLTTGQDSDSG